MSFNIKDGGAWRPCVSVWVKDGGSWQPVSGAWVKDGGAWQQVFTSLEATVDDASPSSGGSGFSPCGDPGTTGAVTVTPVGGTPPYTYAWVRVGAAATSGPYQANAPTSASTSFSDSDLSVCANDTTATETWRCTVTDDNGQTATVDVTVTLTWVDLT